MTEYLNELVGIIYRGSGVNLATAERLAKKIKEAGYVKLPPDSAILENVSLLKDIGNES